MWRILRTLLALVALGGLTAGCSGSQDTDLTITGTINGEEIGEAGRTNPVKIDPELPVRVDVTVSNPTGTDAEVRHLRLEGEVLGMRFAHANTQVDFTVPANGSRSYAADIDFFDLAEQVTGQAASSLGVYDEERQLLAEEDFFIDVDGSWTSTLGITFFQVLIFAVASLAMNWLGLIRHRLPANRFVRGLRFAATGLATGVAVVLLLSLVGLWLPGAAVWIPLLIIATVGGFALGYVSPGPAYLDDEEEDELLVARR